MARRVTFESNFNYEVVLADDFRAVVKAWIKEWELSRPPILGKAKAQPGYFIATNLLIEKSGVPRTTIEAIMRTDVGRSRQYISLDIVDKLLTAMGLNHYLTDGTLQVIPNPTVSFVRYQEWRSLRGCVD